MLRTRDGLPVIEPNPDLAPLLARGLYDDPGEFHRMMHYDGVIGGVSLLMMQTITGARRVLDKPINPTPLEEEVYEATSEWIGLGEESSDEQPRGIMRGGLRRLYRHMCKAHDYGFALFEHNIEAVTIAGRRMLAPVDVSWVAPWSVNRWIYQGKRIVAFEQVVQKHPDGGFSRVSGALSTDRDISTEYEFVIVPFDRCLLHSPLAVDGNPEGQCVFRTAWPWYRATMDAVKQDMRLVDRLLYGMTIFGEMMNSEGVVAEVSEQDIDMMFDMFVDWLDGDVPAFWKAAGVEIDHQWPSRDGAFSEERMRYYDAQKLMSIGAMLLNLQNAHAGSQALEESMSRAFYSFMGFLAEEIDATINGMPGIEGSGLIERFVSLNFPSTEKIRVPTIRTVNIRQMDVDRLINMMSRAAQFLLFTVTPEDEKLFREMAGLHRMSLEEIKKEREEVRARAGQMSQEGTQSGQGPQETPASVRAERGDKSQDGQGAQNKDDNDRPRKGVKKDSKAENKDPRKDKT